MNNFLNPAKFFYSAMLQFTLNKTKGSFLFIILCSATLLSGYSLNAQKLLTLEEAIATALQNNYNIQLSKNDSMVAALDYSYRHSNPFEGSHAIGVKMSLGSSEE